jgi:hypothetical protein
MQQRNSPVTAKEEDHPQIAQITQNGKYLIVLAF